VLDGAAASRDTFAAAAEAELAHAQPLRDNAFKVPLTRNILITTLEELCA
jgi:xanthine dehydrogenase YagS FAD-binding subunit